MVADGVTGSHDQVKDRGWGASALDRQEFVARELVCGVTATLAPHQPVFLYFEAALGIVCNC